MRNRLQPDAAIVNQQLVAGLDPLTSYKLRFSQDFAGLGGDTKSVTTSALAGVESNAWREEVTLRAEFEVGAIYSYSDYSTWILDRYRNGTRIRGFEPNGLGPRDLAAENEDGLGGNYFWAVRTEAQFPVGLFWTTPIGPLRFNFSKAIKKEDYDEEQNFDLTISTRF